MDNKVLVETLHQNRLMNTEEEIELFERTLGQIASNPQDLELLPSLLDVFDDNTTHQNVMWTLLHYIETFAEAFSVKEYVQVLMEFDPILLSSAEEWLGTLLIRSLNAENYRQEMKAIFPTLPEKNQEALRKVLKPLQEEIPGRSKERLQRNRDLINYILPD